MKRIGNILIVLSILVGIFFMVYAGPYLWSASLVDLVGAGFPFLAGAILLGAGLIAFAIWNQTEKKD